MNIEILKRFSIGLVVLSLVMFQSCKKDVDPVPPVDTCNTANVSYAQVVVPILQENCYGCHSGDDPSGGFTFDTHETLVSETVDNQRLKGTIDRLDGFAAMPPTAALDACKVSQIKAWVDQGALNN